MSLADAFNWAKSNSGTESTTYRGVQISKTHGGQYEVNGQKVSTPDAAVTIINKQRGRW